LKSFLLNKNLYKKNDIYEINNKSYKDFLEGGLLIANTKAGILIYEKAKEKKENNISNKKNKFNIDNHLHK
jgi:hypothetical protein